MDLILHDRRQLVVERSKVVLDYLLKAGPSFLTSIALALGMAGEHQKVRYALVLLRQQNQVHISAFPRVVGEDGIPRWAALFAAGPGDDAKLPFGHREEKVGPLDFASTQHLQPVYVEWTRTRTPDFVQEEEA